MRQRRRRRARPHGRHRHASPSCSPTTGERDFEEAFVKLAFAPERAGAERAVRRSTRRRLDRPAQGARRCAARPAHAAHRAGVVGADGAAGAGRDLGAGRLARVARRAARGLRRRHRARADAAQLPRAPDLRGQGGAGRLRGAAAPADASAIRWSWCRPDFEAALVRGDAPVVEIVSDSAQPALARRARRASSACSAASAASARCCSLALRGVSAQLLEPMQIEDARPRQHADAGDAHHRHAAVLRDDGGALRRAQRGARHDRRRARARLARAAADEPGRALGAGRRQVGRGRRASAC